MVIQRHFRKTFSVTHETYYYANTMAHRDFEYQICIGFDPIDGDAGLYQFALRWQKVTGYRHDFLFQVIVFDDCLAAFNDFPELFSWLPTIVRDQEITPDLVKAKLYEWCYFDVTTRVKPGN